LLGTRALAIDVVPGFRHAHPLMMNSRFKRNERFKEIVVLEATEPISDKVVHSHSQKYTTKGIEIYSHHFFAPTSHNHNPQHLPVIQKYESSSFVILLLGLGHPAKIIPDNNLHLH
jgi:hypothetical protein